MKIGVLATIKLWRNEFCVVLWSVVSCLLSISLWSDWSGWSEWNDWDVSWNGESVKKVKKWNRVDCNDCDGEVVCLVLLCIQKSLAALCGIGLKEPWEKTKDDNENSKFYECVVVLLCSAVLFASGSHVSIESTVEKKKEFEQQKVFCFDWFAEWECNTQAMMVRLQLRVFSFVTASSSPKLTTRKVETWIIQKEEGKKKKITSFSGIWFQPLFLS